MTDKFHFKKVKKFLPVSAVLAMVLLIYFLVYFLPAKNEFGFRRINNSEDVTEYIKSELGICYEMKGSHKCYQSAAKLFMQQFDYEEILAEFRSGEDFREIFSRCHEVAHYIGRDAYKIERSIPVLFSKRAEACWGGFYHGVVEGYFEAKQTTSPQRLAEEIKLACGKKEDYESPRAWSECIHGIGHALMFISNGDLPKSLKYCDELPSQQSDTCYGGVFMENSSSSTNMDHPTEYLRSGDPFYPCNILDEKYLHSCYSYQSSYFAELSDWDWEKTAQLCARVPEPYQDRCFLTIGTNQVGFTGDLPKMHQTCALMPTLARERICTEGVVDGLSGRFRSNPAKLIEFCSTAPEWLKKDCWSRIGTSASDWTAEKNDVKLICKTSDMELYEACRKSYENKPL